MMKILRYIFSILLICLATHVVAQTGKWRDIYKVKKKDTIFGIARMYGITLPELLDANPEMKAEGYQLNKDTYVFIPFTKTSGTATTAPEQRAINGFAQSSAIRIGVMLPLHDVDGDGKRMIEYYRGLLIACDSLRAQGISTDVHAWNVDIDTDISRITRDPAAARCNMIFGPLYTHQVRGLAEFCKARDIKMIIPFSIDGDDVVNYEQIFQVWESPDKLNNSTIDAYIRRFPNAHTVFIDCNDKTSKKGVFTFGLRNRLTNRNISYSVTNLNNSEELFAKAFSTTKNNVVILNTGRSPELRVALAKLESLRYNHPSIRVTLFGYTDWLMYTDYNMDKFFMFDTYIPSYFYYNAADPATRQFARNYYRWFGQNMQYALPRFALTGYDHGQFFLRGYHRYGKAFKGLSHQNKYRALQTPLSFKQVGSAGMQNEYFELIHFTPDHRIESIAY